MAIGTRERIVDATAECFRRQGYAGTGLKQIAAEADAAFGSLYHFFPGGKEELGAEVIRWSGRMYMQLFIDIALEEPDVVAAVGRFFTDAARDVEASGFADACPIATVALEVSSTSEPLREACADVFASWLTSATEYFAGAGIERAQARRLALCMLSLLEGAFIFSRAMRTTEPVLVAGEAAATAVKEALAG
ncbi:MAG: TetR/AcrR family transcriptional regulator [Actinobacteria bacterium]|nr:MAG: TetR/AcrR family transcriptional regulator [Actinomycetota bacterium]